jgi:hypothetical protein
MGRAKSLCVVILQTRPIGEDYDKFPSAFRFKTVLLRWDALNGPLMMCTPSQKCASHRHPSRTVNMTTPAEIGFGNQPLSSFKRERAARPHQLP